LKGRDDIAGHPDKLQDRGIRMGARQSLIRTPVYCRCSDNVLEF
jgi:hypothetical protein